MLRKLLNSIGLSPQSDIKKLQEVIEELETVKFNNARLQFWAKKIKKAKKCDICSSAKSLQAHHIYPKSVHPTLAYEKSNGVCLCEKCHNELHKEFPLNEFLNPIQYSIFKEIELGKLAEVKLKAYNSGINNTLKQRHALATNN